MILVKYWRLGYPSLLTMEMRLGNMLKHFFDILLSHISNISLMPIILSPILKTEALCPCKEAFNSFKVETKSLNYGSLITQSLFSNNIVRPGFFPKKSNNWWWTSITRDSTFPWKSQHPECWRSCWCDSNISENKWEFRTPPFAKFMILMTSLRTLLSSTDFFSLLAFHTEQSTGLLCSATANPCHGCCWCSFVCTYTKETFRVQSMFS